MPGNYSSFSKGTAYIEDEALPVSIIDGYLYFDIQGVLIFKAGGSTVLQDRRPGLLHELVEVLNLEARVTQRETGMHVFLLFICLWWNKTAACMQTTPTLSSMHTTRVTYMVPPFAAML